MIYHISDRVSPTATLKLAETPEWSGYSPSLGPGYNGELTGDFLRAGVDWIVTDFYSDGDEERSEKKCYFKQTPAPADDVDFFRYKNVWYKLRKGQAHFSLNGFSVKPATQPCCGGWPTPNYFPVKNPFFLYRVQIVRQKFRAKALSPHEYLLHLKANVGSCADIPI